MKKYFLLSLLLFSNSLTALASENERDIELRNQHFSNIDELVTLRAPGLAYRYLEREQPEYNRKDPVEWLFWEQKRLQLLRYLQRWDVLVERVKSDSELLSSPRIATADRNWFFTEQLHALVNLGRYPLALQKTRELLWSASELVDSKTLATWRRIIINIYLKQQSTLDAQVAMRRYQQDYGELRNEDGLSWLQLQAELLIQLKQYNEAVRLLKQIDTEEARALQMLTMLEDRSISAMDLLDNANMLVTSQQQDSDNKYYYQYLSLVANIRLEKLDSAIRLLETMLQSEGPALSPAFSQLANVEVSASTLWKLYLKYGNQVANQQGLLNGDDSAWYALANNYFESQPTTAIALFSALALQARDSAHRQLSMNQMARVIGNYPVPLRLVNLLFTESGVIESVADLPAEVRYQLIDYNLSKGNIEAAALLMSGLQQPPAEQPQFDWNLRRARVLILSGSFEKGAELLIRMLGQETLEKGQADKYLQVVFDLQAVEQHPIALKLFGQLQSLVDDVELQRELNFWRAESYSGLKQFEQAAYLFLRSAQSPEKAYDPWYHTATFRAAESLMDAGLYDDASLRFKHLLKITANSARKAVIRQRLQAIQLKLQVKK